MLSYTEKPNAVRRLMRFSLEWMNRIKGVDVILFFIVMLLKQLWFNKLIHVPNMDMDGYDTVVAIGTLALVTFWTFWLPTRGRIIALIALNLLLSFIMYADLIYYRYFQDFISVPVLLQANQVDSLGESIGTLMHAKDFLLGVDWLLIIPFGVYVIWKGRSDLRRDSHGYGYGYSSQRKTPFWRKAVIRIAVSAAIFAIGMSMSIGNVNEAKKHGRLVCSTATGGTSRCIMSPVSLVSTVMMSTGMRSCIGSTPSKLQPKKRRRRWRGRKPAAISANRLNRILRLANTKAAMSSWYRWKPSRTL